MITTSYFSAQTEKTLEDSYGFLRGIVIVNNIREFGKDIDNKYALSFSSPHNLMDYCKVLVTFDNKGNLRLDKKNLADSKEAFRVIVYTLTREDHLFNTATAVYDNGIWQLVEKCVKAHRNRNNEDKHSTFDIFRKPADVNFIVQHVMNDKNISQQRIEVNLDKNFLFEENSIKFRVDFNISDPLRGLRFKASFLAKASKDSALYSDTFCADMKIARYAHVCLPAFRVAILGAIEQDNLTYSMMGNFRNDSEIDPARWMASYTYEKVVRHCVALLHGL